MVTKYNRVITTKICKKIEEGVPFKHAAIASGLSEATFWVFMKKYPEFKEAIEKAKAKGLTKLIIEIRQDKSLQAKIWLAERWAPQELHLESQAQKNLEEKVNQLAQEIADSKGINGYNQVDPQFKVN